MNLNDVRLALAAAFDVVEAGTPEFVGTTRYDFTDGLQGWTGDAGTAVADDDGLRLSGSDIVRKDDAGTLRGGELTGAILRMVVTLESGAGAWAARLEWQNQSFQWQNPTSTTYEVAATGETVSGLIEGAPVLVTCTFTAITNPRAFAIQLTGTGAVVALIDDIKQGAIELAEARGIEGITVHSFYADRITAPAVVVGWPDPYEYDLTMGRGTDSATFPVLVLVSKNDAESAAVELGAYCNGSGARSVKTVIEDHDSGGVYDTAVVESVEFSVVTVAGTEYLGAEFAVTITGNGA